MMIELKSLCLAIVLLPLLASLIVGLFKSIIGKKGAALICILAVGLSFFSSCWVLKLLTLDELPSTSLKIYTWGVFSTVTLDIGFLIDKLSALMMVIVSFVSFMVHIYTVGYMQDDPGFQRFFSYIAAFTFGMLMLVMSNNFLQLFFGWEAVGLMSYLLIGFWYQKETAIFASLKAFLVNRLGDLGFLLGIAAVFYYFGSLDYATVFEHANSVNATHASALTIICICLFIGAMGKSAQMPLHVWLPDSMEGPTPISALIHAATMVTAGVFMVARMSPLFELSNVALNVVLTIGAITCVLTGLLGIVQNDIKRIIAYSTLSQLGYMMTAMGVSAYSVGIFHLMTHAFFKALLFLGAGSVIIAVHHEQNIWKMGNLRKYMPITYITMLIGSLALIGFPFFSGFYSKDLIIESVEISQLPAATFAYWVVLGSVLITSIYTFRLFFVVFHGKENVEPSVKTHLHETAPIIYWPLILLAIPSLIIGALFVKPLFDNFFGSALFVDPNHEVLSHLAAQHEDALQIGLKGLASAPFVLGLLGIVVSWLCYVKYPELPMKIQKRFSLLYVVLKEKYGFDLLYQNIIVPKVRSLGAFFWQIGDQWAIDTIGVNGSANTVQRLSGELRKLQTGYLYHYAFTMITGFLLLLVWLMLI